MSALLDVRGLSTVYDTPEGQIRAVDGVDLTVGRGEILGVVGESGSGKTALVTSLMRLIKPPGRILKGGEMLLDGEDLFRLPRSEMPARRGKDLALIPQSAMHALNPVISVDRQVAEAITAHGRAHRDALRVARERLREVGIPPERHRAYPHELSGGMRQRCVIAMAIANEPKLVIADEPVSGLDVVVQARILRLIHELKESRGLSMILVSHDLPTVAKACDRVAVMYAGRIVEEGKSKTILEEPLHPYTRALVEAIPRVHGPKQTLRSVPGEPPDLNHLPPGCNFRPRCPAAFTDCEEVDPSLEEIERGRKVACLLYHHKGARE